MTIRIYHNTRCSKSRKTLELLQANGISPQIVAYLQEPPAASELRALAGLLGLPLKSLLRTGEDEFKADSAKLDLDDEASLACWLHEHPQALERPIVVDDVKNRAVIGRPPENVLELIAP
ncbi:MAG: arsenate reductase (glutaredoxin) [Woeseia sp.]